MCHGLVTIGAGVIDNVAPAVAAAAAALVCNACNVPLTPTSALFSAPAGGAAAVDTPPLIFVTVNDNPAPPPGAPPQARSLASSPTAEFYGRTYHLLGAISTDGRVFFRAPVRRGYIVFTSAPAASQWGVVQSDGLVCELQGATAHIAATGAVLFYASEDTVEWAGRRHARYNEFH